MAAALMAARPVGTPIPPPIPSRRLSRRPSPLAQLMSARDTYLNLPLRLRPGAFRDRASAPGTEVEVVGEDGDWYRVVIPEATGYVYKDYLDVTGTGGPAAPSEEDGQDAPDPSGSGFDEDTP